MMLHPFFSPDSATTGINYLDQESRDDLYDLMDGDGEMLIELIDTLLEDSPELIASLGNAIETNDIPLIQRDAHSLKSSNQQFGAFNFAQICSELEKDAKQGDVSRAKSLYSDIKHEFTKVEAALNAWKNTLE